jgi:hypothetical protein
MPSESIEEQSSTNHKRKIEHAPNGKGISWAAGRRRGEVKQNL